MDYLISIIFGLVQGATEFLPVSSSGHLIILHSFFDLPALDTITFDISLHLATLLAVLIVLRGDILKITISWLKSFAGKSGDGRMGWLIILGTIPAGFIGFFFESYFESFFRSPFVVSLMLFLVGVLFIFIESRAKQSKNLFNITLKMALLIGIAQALALIPGTSRSGITIITGLALGLKREDAVKFSFLLSVPIILGASAKNFPEFLNSLQGENIVLVLFAFFSAFISALFSIKFLLNIAGKIKLNVFAYYRISLALILFLLLIFNFIK